jgi:hypothetical protein
MHAQERLTGPAPGVGQQRLGGERVVARRRHVQRRATTVEAHLRMPRCD